MPPSADKRSVTALVAAILDNLQDIVRSEVRLAKAEIKEEASEATRPAIRVAAGLALAFYALGLFIVALVVLLSRFVELAVAAALVGGLVASGAIALVIIGRREWKLFQLTPEKAVQAFRENVSWIRTPSKLQSTSDRRAAN